MLKEQSSVLQPLGMVGYAHGHVCQKSYSSHEASWVIEHPNQALTPAMLTDQYGFVSLAARTCLLCSQLLGVRAYGIPGLRTWG